MGDVNMFYDFKDFFLRVFLPIFLIFLIAYGSVYSGEVLKEKKEQERFEQFFDRLDVELKKINSCDAH